MQCSTTDLFEACMEDFYILFDLMIALGYSVRSH
jgi:hypothetical protein